MWPGNGAGLFSKEKICKGGDKKKVKKKDKWANIRYTQANYIYIYIYIYIAAKSKTGRNQKRSQEHIMPLSPHWAASSHFLSAFSDPKKRQSDMAYCSSLLCRCQFHDEVSQCLQTAICHYLSASSGHANCLQCFDAVGWVAGRASGL